MFEYQYPFISPIQTIYYLIYGIWVQTALDRVFAIAKRVSAVG